jgi:hypothetical protein
MLPIADLPGPPSRTGSHIEEKLPAMEPKLSKTEMDRDGRKRRSR